MRINTTVNGEKRQVDDVWEGESLLYVLRERMGLPGSKNACEQGECGSCTVYLDHVPVCACLVAAGQAEGREIVTVEGAAAMATSCTPCSRPSSRPARSSAASAPPGCSSPPTTCSSAASTRATRRSGRRWPETFVVARDTRRSSTRCTSPRTGCRTRNALAMAATSPASPTPTAPDRARTVIQGCAIATMDPARTELSDGHVVISGNRIETVGEGPAPEIAGAKGGRRLGLPAHPRPGQHPPPPLPVGDARARCRRHALRVADHALPGVGGDRRVCRERRRPRRPRLARAHRLHPDQ